MVTIAPSFTLDLQELVSVMWRIDCEWTGKSSYPRRETRASFRQGVLVGEGDSPRDGRDAARDGCGGDANDATRAEGDGEGVRGRR